MDYITHGPGSMIVEMGAACDRLIVLVRGNMDLHIEGYGDREGISAIRTLQVIVGRMEKVLDFLLLIPRWVRNVSSNSKFKQMLVRKCQH